MSHIMKTGESPCHECKPDSFIDNQRSKIFLPLCEYHLSLVRPISNAEIAAALELGRQDREAFERSQPAFIPPRGYFR